MKYLLAA